jgi:putative aminopeptidase FrvX
MKPVKDNAQPPRVGAAQLRLLERLTNACAVSGDEGEVRAIVLEQVRPHADEIKIDALGNVLVTRRGSAGRPEERLRVMVAAHMDEVGLMIIADDDKDDGAFRFDIVGGLDARHLAGKPVWVGRQHIPGVIGAKPIHLTTTEERRSALTVDSLRVDVGPGNSGRVKLGDRVAFATSFTRLGSSLRAKALDDRFGVATLIELVKRPPANIDLLAAFTVQEEVGLRGASVAAHALDPHVAFALDATPANDLPDWEGSENTRYNTRLGAGPAIYIADGATLSDPRLVRLLIETAEALHLPYQIRQPGTTGGTDAGSIHKRRAGIPSVSLSVPTRYLHTPASLARLADWKDCMALIHAALRRLTPERLSTARE